MEKKNSQAYKVYLWLFILVFIVYAVLFEVYIYTSMEEISFSEEARYKAADNNTVRLFALCITLFVLLPLARAVCRTSKGKSKKVNIFSKIMIVILSIGICADVIKILFSIL